jgi:hypothetical protein
MSIVSSRIATAYNTVANLYASPYRAASLEQGWASAAPAPNSALLDTLLAYYFSNALYDELNLVISGVENTAAYQKIKSIRNPVSAFVSFYQFKLFPNPFIPVPLAEGTARGTLDRIAEIWRRSAWLRMKNRAAFQFSLFGELFFRAAQRESDGAPMLQLVDPRHVTELDLDDRGYITWIKTEIPYNKRDQDTGRITAMLRVEVWQKGRRRVWELDQRLYLAGTTASGAYAMPVGNLPTTTPTIDASFAGGELPVDFVPIAYAPFISVDNGRGVSPVLTALEDIDEVNRSATRLHAMIFRGGRNTWAIQANQVAPDGRPMPAPMLNPNGDTIELEDGDAALRLPGNSSLTSLVPTLPYADALKILMSDIDFLTEFKLFELGYFKTTTGTEESGRARRYRLAPALNRAEDARGAVLDALARAHQMCFTIGQAADIEGYSTGEVGTYDGDGYGHAFQEVDMLSVSTEEQAETLGTLTGAGGSLDGSARVAGFTNEEVTSIVRGDMVDGIDQ